MDLDGAALLEASGWARAFDGTAAPGGLASALEGAGADGCGDGTPALLLLGCGRGVWLPAVRGVRGPVLAVDASRPALAAARDRVTAADADLAARTTFLHADLREAPPLQAGAIVLLAPPGLVALGTDAERGEVLSTAARSLRPGGRCLVTCAATPLDLPVRRDARPSEPFPLPGIGEPARRLTWREAPGAGWTFVHHRFEVEEGRIVAGAGVLLRRLDDGDLARLAEAAGLRTAGPPLPVGDGVRLLPFALA